MSKVFEKMIFKKMYKFCMENNLLTSKNSGFHKNDGTVNQLIYLVHNIYKTLDSGNEMCMIFLDQSRAFDRIWHKGLIHKLKNLGLATNLVSWFQSYLSDRKIKVVLDGQSSDLHNISAGVPQGSILGPLLFLVYINDITTNIEANISLYADDTCLYVEICEEDHAEKEDMLNRDLERLNKWSEKWYMHFNPLKTSYMKFSNRQETNYDLNIILNNTLLSAVDEHKHLGLILTPKLDFGPHIDHIVKKCSKWIGLIWKLQRKFPRHSLENIFTSYIRPVIEYCHILYDNISDHNAKRLESIQRKAAVACTGAYVNTSHNRLLQELGWPLLSDRRKYAKLVMIFKLVNNLAPGYLTSLLPQTRQQASTHPSRNPNNIIIPLTRLQSYKKSFIPSAIALWNSLSEDIKILPTLPAFKRRIKPSTSKCKAFSMGCGTGSINLTRMRLNMSGLNNHLYTVGIKETSMCLCINNQIEDPNHFLCVCPHYIVPRTVMLEELMQSNAITNMDATADEALTNILLNGINSNTDMQNRSIFIIVEKYIISSGRFS